MADTLRELAKAHLFAGALFFAMRSCEYLWVSWLERKTRCTRGKDVVFWVGPAVVPHDKLDEIEPDSVSITFGRQKSEIKDETVTQDATDDPQLNPVTHWKHTIQRLRSYPNYSDEWPVSTFHDGTKFSRITSKEMLILIRAAVDFIGPDVLGFTSDEVGTHSGRAAAAMLMILAKEPTYSVMLIGRWSSDAFLTYIEKQIKEFTRGVSSRMLTNDTFFNVPHASTTTNNATTTVHGQSHHRRVRLNLLYGRQGSLRHQLRAQN